MCQRSFIFVPGVTHKSFQLYSREIFTAVWHRVAVLWWTQSTFLWTQAGFFLHLVSFVYKSVCNDHTVPRFLFRFSFSSRVSLLAQPARPNAFNFTRFLCVRTFLLVWPSFFRSFSCSFSVLSLTLENNKMGKSTKEPMYFFRWFHDLFRVKGQDMTIYSLIGSLSCFWVFCLPTCVSACHMSSFVFLFESIN